MGPVGRSVAVRMTGRSICLCGLILAAATGYSREPVNGPFVLAERGRPAACSVVVPVHPSPCATNAAAELVKYVERMTGVRLRVVSEPVKVNGRAVSLGDTSLAAAVLGEGDDLPHGSFRTAVRGGTLFIRGGGDRGV